MRKTMCGRYIDYETAFASTPDMHTPGVINIVRLPYTETACRVIVTIAPDTWHQSDHNSMAEAWAVGHAVAAQVL